LSKNSLINKAKTALESSNNLAASAQKQTNNRKVGNNKHIKSESKPQNNIDLNVDDYRIKFKSNDNPMMLQILKKLFEKPGTATETKVDKIFFENSNG
jgi:hypothetical protein